MDIKEKRDELSLLRDNRNKLLEKKNNILNKRFGKTNAVIHLIMSGIVFAMSFNLFLNVAPILIFLSTFGYFCFIPGMFYHKNKVKVKILDVDINTLNNNIDVLSKEVIELERKNLLDMVSDENIKKQTELFNETRKNERMPEFNRENIESNISNEDLGMKLSLHR